MGGRGDETVSRRGEAMGAPPLVAFGPMILTLSIALRLGFYQGETWETDLALVFIGFPGKPINT